MRNAEHVRKIRAVVAAFGEHAEHFVFVGGCVLGLYARAEGAPLRMTEDVDCISSLSPWVRQEKILAELCQAGVIEPDESLQCRYRIGATVVVDEGATVVVDVLSPEGANVGGVNPWFARAAARAARYEIGEGEAVGAVTPPYFLVTKLVAFADRGPDAQLSKDAEDIVALAVEVPSLVEEVEAEGLRDDVAALWERVFDKYGLARSDLADLVDWHLDRQDGAHRDRVIDTLAHLAGGWR
jgi:predicted nucleotidyltransferase